MKVRSIITLCLCFLIVASIVPVLAANEQSVSADKNKLVYIVPVKQTIETGLQSFLVRAFKDAEQAAAKFIVLDINTFGGRVDAAEGIGELIRGSTIPTVAFIHGKAVSAGSYIALNATKIVMAPGSSIGAAAVVDISGKEIESAKVISHWASAMKAAAEMRGRDPLIAEGMADKNLVVPLPKINKTFEKGQIVSLTAEEALKVGYAEKIASNLQEVLEFIDAAGYTAVPFAPSPAENLARVLTNPFVMTLLLFIGIAGVAIELFAPGFGLPGILGVTGFGLYFFGHYIAGFAGVEDVLFFIAGIVLLLVEIFVPSFGILGILGIISIISGVVMAAYDTENALMSLGVAFVLAIIVVAVFIKFFKHRGVWNKFILKDELRTESGYISQASREHLLGKHGVTVTPLRPSGTVLIDNQRVDVVTDGEFVVINQKVVVVKAEGTRVVVRELLEL